MSPTDVDGAATIPSATSTASATADRSHSHATDRHRTLDGSPAWSNAGAPVHRRTRPLHSVPPPVVVVAAGAWMALLLSQGWLYSDDLYNLTEAERMGFGWDYLTRDLFGHVVPGFMTLAWLVAGPGGGSYGWAVAETVIGFVAVLALVGPAARSLGASPRAALTATALTGASSLWVGATLWWSAALNAVPGAFGGLAFLLAHVRWLDQRRPLQLVAAGVALALSLSAQEGSMTFLVVVAGVTAAWYVDGPPASRIRGLLRLWPAWLTYALPCLAFALLWQVAGTGIGDGPPDAPTLLSFPFVAMTTGYLPGQLGLSLRQAAPGTGALVTVLVLVVAAGVLRRWIRATGLSGWWPVAIVVTTVAARTVLVGWARSGLLGYSAAADQRYLADLAWVAPVVFAAGWSRRATGPDRAVAGNETTVGVALHQASHDRRWATAVVAVLLCGGLVGQAVVAPSVGSYAARDWHDRFVTSYRKQIAATPGASVLDVAAGRDLAPPLLARFTLLSRTMAFGVDDMRFNDPSRELIAPDGSGVLRPVQLRPVTSLDLAGSRVVAGDGATPTSTPGAANQCWTSSSAPVVVWVPLERGVGQGTWVLRLREVRSSLPWTAVNPPLIFVSTGDGARTRLDFVVHADAGGTRLLTPTPFGADLIGFQIEPYQRLCIGDASLTKIVVR